MSPRMEGVHLRGGWVARGGLRWSDRPEDFRTEDPRPDEGAERSRTPSSSPSAPRAASWSRAAPGVRSATAYTQRGGRGYQNFCGGCSTSPTTSSVARSSPPPDVVRHDARRPVPRRRCRQGDGDFLRLRQRDLERVRLLARRRLRIGRLGGLRPQGDGHHGARRVGLGAPAFPRARRRRRSRRTAPSSASATCPGTCSATGCCSPSHLSSSPPSTTAHVFLDPDARIRRRPSRSASGCSSCPLVLGGLRRVAASPPAVGSSPGREVDRDLAGGAGMCSTSRPSRSTPDELIRAILGRRSTSSATGGSGRT